MKVLMINSSPRKNGCTYTALAEIEKTLHQEGIEGKIIHLGSDPIRDCTACGGCKNLDNRCVFDDDIVNEILREAKQADGFIFGTPVYYAHPSGRLLSVLDRAFYAGKELFAYKPGAAVVSARRAGTSASLDVINKYFTIAQMPVVSSSYWNMVHGNTPQEVQQDLEGLQTMRNLARNMAWMLKCIDCARKHGIIPAANEQASRTNFIR